jgi:hypothetical protein
VAHGLSKKRFWHRYSRSSSQKDVLDALYAGGLEMSTFLFDPRLFDDDDFQGALSRSRPCSHAAILVNDVHAFRYLAEAAYCPSRCGAFLCMMKNCELAEFGIMERAMEMTPRVCLRGLFTPFDANSPLMFLPEPPVPVPSGQPPGS